MSNHITGTGKNSGKIKKYFHYLELMRFNPFNCNWRVFVFCRVVGMVVYLPDVKV